LRVLPPCQPQLGLPWNEWFLLPPCHLSNFPSPAFFFEEPDSFRRGKETVSPSDREESGPSGSSLVFFPIAVMIVFFLVFLFQTPPARHVTFVFSGGFVSSFLPGFPDRAPTVSFRISPPICLHLFFFRENPFPPLRSRLSSSFL